MNHTSLLILALIFSFSVEGLAQKGSGGYVKGEAISKIGGLVPNRDKRTDSPGQRNDFEFRWKGEITVPAESLGSPLRTFGIQFWQPTHYNSPEFIVLLVDPENRIIATARHKLRGFSSDERSDFDRPEVPLDKQHFRTVSVVRGNEGAGYLYFTLSTGVTLIFGVDRKLEISFGGIYVPLADQK